MGKKYHLPLFERIAARERCKISTLPVRNFFGKEKTKENPHGENSKNEFSQD